MIAAPRHRAGGGRPQPLKSCVLGVAALLLVGLPAHAFTVAQAQAGARTYRRQCARCHGLHGEGKDNAYKGLRAPELIGSQALPCDPRAFQKLRTHTFRTARDVYAFASATMPADQPAILDADEYWDVIAYLLQANGKAADETPLGPASSASVVLHADCTSAPGAAGTRGQR